MAIRILCIKIDDGPHENPYVAIDSLEWINERVNVKGITERTQLYDWIKTGTNQAYVIEPNGKKTFLIPAECPSGNKYVKTVENVDDTDYLLLLPECF